MADRVRYLISNTIATLKATRERYNVVKDDKSLRAAFHEAGEGLVLVEQALQAATTQLAGDPPNVINSLKACSTKLELSKRLFGAVIEGPQASRFNRYKAAVGDEAGGRTVEALTSGMMKDVCALAEDDAIKAAMGNWVITRLRDASEKLSKMESSVSNEGPGNIFHSYDGDQFNAPWGTQNITRGNGPQFPGATISGGVTFGAAGASWGSA